MSDELVTWLLAQLDEDERVATQALKGPIEEPWRPIASAVTGSEYDAVGQRGYGHREPDEDGLGTYVIADFGALGGSRTSYLLRYQPRRLLAEIEAKRRILDNSRWATKEAQEIGGDPRVAALYEGRRLAFDSVVRWLAVPYADRPGYDEEWRP